MAKPRNGVRTPPSIDEYVDQVVATMPPLTDEQIEAAARILAALPPGGTDSEGSEDRS